MKKVFIFLVIVIISMSCKENNKQKSETTDKEIAKISSICIWDGAALREKPKKDGKYLSPINLGEKVQFLGKEKVDSADNNRKYIKIELSDGTIGWASASIIIVDAYAAALVNEAPIYRRPDLLTGTDKNFEKMEMVAVKQAKDDWIEVVGSYKKKKGWIKTDLITTNEEDVAVAILARKKLYDKNELLIEKIDDFLKALPYKKSIFIDYLKNSLQESNEGEQEEQNADSMSATNDSL